MAFLPTLDTRLRLILLILFSVCCALSMRPLTLAFLALTSLLLLILARPRLRDLQKRFCAVNTFILFLWLITPITTQGTPCVQIGPFVASVEGVQLATLVTVKANILTGFFIALLGGMSISTLGHALGALHVPAKLTFLLLFTERSFYQQAAKLRGFVAGTNLRSYLTIAQLLGILLIRSLDHARKAHEALLLRGFSGTFRSTWTFQIRARDLICATFLLLVLALSLLLESGSIPSLNHYLEGLFA